MEFHGVMDVTGTTEHSPAAKHSARRRLYWLAVGVVVTAFIVGWFLRGRDSSEATVAILPLGHVIEAMPGPALDRLIPLSWGWLWKLRYAVFGKPAIVDVEHVLLQLSSDAEEVALQTVNTRPALVTSNGVSAWMIDLDDAKQMKIRVMQQSGAVSRGGRVSLGAGTVATLSGSTGPAVAGVPVPPGTSSTYAVRPRGNGIEILGSFVSWEVATNTNVEATRNVPAFTLDTNLMMTVSMFVPDGQAVYLHRVGTGEARRPSTAVLVLPRIR